MSLLIVMLFLFDYSSALSGARPKSSPRIVAFLHLIEVVVDVVPVALSFHVEFISI